MCGMGVVWFIPSGSFKWAAALIAVAYYVVLVCYLRSGKTNGKGFWERVAQQPLAIVGFIIFAYFAYLTFYVILPACVTQVLGVPAQRRYVITHISTRSGNAILCPYSVELDGDDSFCMDESAVERLSVGEPIDLEGKESIFGFRFLNVQANNTASAP
jgi:hypothetical protein